MEQKNYWNQYVCITLKASFLAALAVFSQNIKAQITIGSSEIPHEKALLDLKENAAGTATKGLILPRVALDSATNFFGIASHVAGTIVYNTGTSTASVTAANRVSPGFYYNNGVRWEKLSLGYANWFYMPSVPIETSSTLTGQTLDLYGKYKTQFSGLSGNFAKSPDAPPTIPYFPASTNLYYYITDYDPAVFSNISISNNGVMTYDVTAAATYYSFINIVFVLK
jgi:hypothetical protein